MKQIRILVLLIPIFFGVSNSIFAQEELPDTVWTKNIWPEHLVEAKFTPDGDKIIAATDDDIFIYETITGNKLDSMLNVHKKTSRINSFDVSPSGSILATGGINGEVLLWNVNTKDTIASFKHNAGIWDLSFSYDGSEIFVITDAEGDNNIYVWNTESFKLITKFGDNDESKNIAISKDGKYFATNSIIYQDGEWHHRIKLWDALGYKLINTLGTHDNDITAMDFSPDGRYLATCGHDGIIKIFDIKNSELINEIIHNNEFKNLEKVLFSKNSKYLISSISIWEHWNIKIWDFLDNKLIHTYYYPLTKTIDIDKNNNYIIGGVNEFLYLLNAKWTGTSVGDSKSFNSLIYPNPARDYIVINLGEYNGSRHIAPDIKIYDVLGNVVNTLTPTLSLRERELRIDVSHLPTGLYFVRVGDEFLRFVKL